jgi:hypothetical protein
VEGEVLIDPLDLLKGLHRQKIRYVLIGRQALILLGAPVITFDYDFCLSPERGDLDKLLALARELDLEVSRKDVHRRPFFNLLTDTQKFDFFRARGYATKDGRRFTWDGLWERHEEAPLRDFTVNLPSIPDLILLKQARNAPRDREDIKYLQALLDREGRKPSRKRRRR